MNLDINMDNQYRETRVKLDQASMKIDEFGTLRARARVARIGVQKYIIDNQLVYEYRSFVEVSKSLATFENKPITLNHPQSSLIDSKSAGSLMKGFFNNLEMDSEGWVVADIHITHEDAVRAAQTTHMEFSLGYFADYADEQGTWVDTEGMIGEAGTAYKYDRAQINIFGNHAALVTRARAGRGATFLDSEDREIVCDEDTIIINQTQPTNQTEMDKVKYIYNDQMFEISGDDADKLVKLVDSLRSQLDSAKSEKEAVEGKVDGLTAEVADLTNKLKLAKEAKVDADLISKEVQARTAIWNIVGATLKADKDYSLTENQVKRLYLKQELPNLSTKIDSADESYIEGLWEIKQPVAGDSKVKDDASPSKEALKEITGAPIKVAKKDSDDAHAAYLASRKNFFKNLSE